MESSSIKTKICTNPNCIHGGKPQPVSNFNRSVATKSGYVSLCKDCKKAYRKSVRSDPKKREEENAKCKEYYDKNKVAISTRRQKRKTTIAATNKRWRESLAKYDSYAHKLSEYYEDVRRDPDNNDLLQVRCKNHLCEKKWFNPTNQQVASRLQALKFDLHCENYLYCSDECKEICPAYNARIDPYDKDTNDKFWDRFRNYMMWYELTQMVLKRDNYTCVKCGASQKEDPTLELCVHHIYPITVEPIYASDMWNCQTYCKDCHKKLHLGDNKNCDVRVLGEVKIPIENLEKMIIE